jgi:hypothetical protein
MVMGAKKIFSMLVQDSIPISTTISKNFQNELSGFAIVAALMGTVCKQVTTPLSLSFLQC